MILNRQVCATDSLPAHISALGKGAPFVDTPMQTRWSSISVPLKEVCVVRGPASAGLLFDSIFFLSFPQLESAWGPVFPSPSKEEGLLLEELLLAFKNERSCELSLLLMRYRACEWAGSVNGVGCIDPSVFEWKSVPEASQQSESMFTGHAKKGCLVSFPERP